MDKDYSGSMSDDSELMLINSVRVRVIDSKTTTKIED